MTESRRREVRYKKQEAGDGRQKQKSKVGI